MTTPTKPKTILGVDCNLDANLCALGYWLAVLVLALLSPTFLLSVALVVVLHLLGFGA